MHAQVVTGTNNGNTLQKLGGLGFELQGLLHPSTPAALCHDPPPECVDTWTERAQIGSKDGEVCTGPHLPGKAGGSRAGRAAMAVEVLLRSWEAER